MTKQAIEALVFRALGSVAPEADPTRLPRDADIREEIDLDSMDFTSFVIRLHEELGIDIPEVDYPKYATIGGAVNELARRLG